MAVVTFLRGGPVAGKKWKKWETGRKEESGNVGGDMNKAIAVQVEPRIKKNIKNLLKMPIAILLTKKTAVVSVIEHGGLV